MIVLHSVLFITDRVVMEDWKLKTTPVVKLKTINKRFAVSFVSLSFE